MISTSSYKTFNKTLYKTYSISGDRGANAGYAGEYFKELAPKLSFWKIWHKNIGKISEEKNNKYYIEEYYKEVLSKLDPELIYKELDYSVLLCYEDNTEFCHRHIVAAWFELFLDVKIRELKCTEEGMKEVERPEYIKEYLEEFIKKNKNMRGFNCLRALYLFEEGEKLEILANNLEDKNAKKANSLRQAACYLRCDADEVEYEYNNQQQQKKFIKTNN